MSSVSDAMSKLTEFASELDTLSKNLAELERTLAPIQGQVDDWMSAFHLGLWKQHVDDGAKLPSEAMREHMARQEMPPELYGRHAALVASRRRMKERISVLKDLVDSQRSILSALKVEADALRVAA